MAVHSIKNQYRGINAHLHSIWQGERKWHRFHNYFIGQLMSLLKKQLLPMGYTALMEESLQIRRLDDGTPRQPQADVLIRDLHPERSLQTSVPVQPGGMIHTLDELEEAEENLEHPYNALVIYQRTEDFQTGDMVAWLELLSPANQGRSRDAYTYLAKRRLLLENGLVFIELDFLHETPPTFERLPDYTASGENASPYRIMVMDPRPEYRQTQVYLHEFAVDEALPTVDIPLNAGDWLKFDFDYAYQQAFVDGVYGYDMDYSQLPLNFERYSIADQTRIVNRMLAVLEAANQGLDLENTPLSVNNLPLTEALAQFDALKVKLQNQG